MKLSIIVPVYNCEEYLRRCLDSLVNQTIDDYEIIAVNDGSTDGSLKILSEYEALYPGKLRVYTLTNGGQGRARNYGIERAEGDFLGFIDSDDWIDVTMFEKLHNTALNENADVVVCDFMESYSDGSTRYVPIEYEEGNILSLAGSASNKIFRRSAVGSLRFPEGLWYEDFLFSAMVLLESGKTAYLRQALYFYRRGHTSTMNNDNAAKNFDIVRVVEMLKAHTQPEQYQWLVLNHVLLEAIKRVSAQTSEDKKRILKELRTFVKKEIPHIGRCRAFTEESAGRKLVMALNYYGLDKLALFLLRFNAAI